MASFLDRFKIKTAMDDHSKLDLSCDHISTANFMQFNVAYSKELVPTEKIDIKMETFTRLLPMPVPTFGRARVNNRAFFVPYRTIFPGWNDFITDTVHVTTAGATFQGPPYFTNLDLLQLLCEVEDNSNSTTAILCSNWNENEPNFVLRKK